MAFVASFCCPSQCATITYTAVTGAPAFNALWTSALAFTSGQHLNAMYLTKTISANCYLGKYEASFTINPRTGAVTATEAGTFYLPFAIVNELLSGQLGGGLSSGHINGGPQAPPPPYPIGLNDGFDFNLGQTSVSLLGTLYDQPFSVSITLADNYLPSQAQGDINTLLGYSTWDAVKAAALACQTNTGEGSACCDYIAFYQAAPANPLYQAGAVQINDPNAFYTSALPPVRDANGNAVMPFLSSGPDNIITGTMDILATQQPASGVIGIFGGPSASTTGGINQLGQGQAQATKVLIAVGGKYCSLTSFESIVSTPNGPSSNYSQTSQTLMIKGNTELPAPPLPYGDPDIYSEQIIGELFYGVNC